MTQNNILREDMEEELYDYIEKVHTGDIELYVRKYGDNYRALWRHFDSADKVLGNPVRGGLVNIIMEDAEIQKLLSSYPIESGQDVNNILGADVVGVLNKYLGTIRKVYSENIYELAKYIYPLSYMPLDELQRIVYNSSGIKMEDFEVESIADVRKSTMIDVIESTYVARVLNDFRKNLNYQEVSNYNDYLLKVQEHLLVGSDIYREYMTFIGQFIPAYRITADNVDVDSVRSIVDIHRIIDIVKERESKLKLGTGLSINNRNRDRDIDITRRRILNVLNEYKTHEKAYKKLGIKSLNGAYSAVLNDLAIELQLKAKYIFTGYSIIVVDKKGKIRYATENKHLPRKMYLEDLAEFIITVEREKIKNKRLKLTEKELLRLISGLVLK